MSSFWIGFIVGFILSPLILAAASKPLMKWLIKKRANPLVADVSKKMGSFQKNIKNLDKKEVEKNVKIDKKES